MTWQLVKDILYGGNVSGNMLLVPDSLAIDPYIPNRVYYSDWGNGFYRSEVEPGVNTALGVYTYQEIIEGEPFDIRFVALDSDKYVTTGYAGSSDISVNKGNISSTLADNFINGVDKRTVTISNTTGYVLICATDTVNQSIYGQATVFVLPETVAPAAIADLIGLAGSTTDQIILRWTAVGDDGYVKDIDGGKYTVKFTTTATDTWSDAQYEVTWATTTSPGNSEVKTITGLIGYNNAHYFWIKTADKRLNWSDLSNKTTAYSPANIPGTGPYTVNRTSITANWLPNGNPNETEYCCERSTSANFVPKVSSGWTTNISTNSESLSMNTTYYFQVKSRNNNGVETLWQSLGSTKTLSVPNTPANLAQYVGNWIDLTFSSKTNYNIIRATFTQSDPAAENTLRYTIEFSTHQTFSYKYITYTSPLLTQGATNYVTSLLPDGTWYWRVWTTNNYGYTSSISTANDGDIAFIIDTVSPPVNEPPNAPSNLSQYTTFYQVIDFGSWIKYQTLIATFTQNDPNSGDTVKFTIQYSTHSDFQYNYISYTSELCLQDATNYVNSQLLPEGTWYWRVWSTDNSDLEGSISTANTGGHAFRIDTSPPANISIEIYASYTTSITVTTNGTDALSGLHTQPYYVEISSVSPFSAFANSGWIGETSTTFTNLSIDSTYWFGVKVRDTVLNESDGSVVSTHTQTLSTEVPAADIVAVYVTSITMHINTDANLPEALYSVKVTSTNGVDQYLQSSYTLGTIAVYQTTTTWGDSIPVKGLLKNTTYSIRVNSFGNEYSSAVSTSTLADTPHSIIAAVYGKEFNSQKGYIQLEWNNNDNPIGTVYELWYASVTPPILYMLCGTTTNISYTDDNLDDETTYYYKLRAKNYSNIHTEFTPVVSVYTPDRTAPATPTNFVTNAGDEFVDISWTANTDPDIKEYRIYRSTSGTGYMVLTTVSHPKTTYQDKGLSNNVFYYYRLTAVDIIGNESYWMEKTTLPMRPRGIYVPVDVSTTIVKVNSVGLTIEVGIDKGTFGIPVYISINDDPINNPEKVNVDNLKEANKKKDTEPGAYRVKHFQSELNVELNAYNVYGSTVEIVGGKLIKITLPYTDKNNDGILDHTWPEVYEDTLGIYLLIENGNKSEWKLAQGEQIVNMMNNSVTVSVTHLSVYGFVGKSMSYTDVAKVIVFPNPCKPGSGDMFDSDFIVFGRMPEQSTIKIFTISGESVVTLKYPDGNNPCDKGMYKWYMKNDANEEVASGVYIYLVTNNKGKKKTGRIGIVR
ncbi:MAG: fibronectin type III domain-containing protein [Elusimicrobiota bacterium]